MRVFISYAHVDWQFVTNLARRLDKFHEVWFDDRLHAGEDWWLRILDRLDWCNCYLYVLSPESLESQPCQDEYLEAERLGKSVVPVRLQSNIALPGALKSIHYSDFAERLFEDALVDLIGDLNVLERKLDYVDKPTTKNVRKAPNKRTTKFNEVATFRNAVEARKSEDFETALRLFQTIQEKTPDFLSEQVASLIAVTESTLKIQARQKEYRRLYIQVGLLTLDQHTHADARRMWIRLRQDFPEIYEDPENLEARTMPPQHSIQVLETTLESTTSSDLSRLEVPDSVDTERATPTEPNILHVLPPPFEWVYIPGGQVTLVGEIRWAADYTPDEGLESYIVEPFLIAKFPLTNAQFQVFIDAPDGYCISGWWDFSTQAQRWHKKNEKPMHPAFDGRADHPRANVSWFEAVAFCRWLDARMGQYIFLPTEQQWQRVAQGDDNRMYPWGNQAPDSIRANWNTDRERTTSVGKYPEGASPYGVLDMAGNVWEWCRTDDETNESDIHINATSRVMRGGSWFNRIPTSLQTTSRASHDPDTRSDDIGFRIAHF